ncbi:hypothetical protein [Pedobacter sp. HMWF019]|nr:hypothetical protein [Pedobacter sp. HMWF019]
MQIRFISFGILDGIGQKTGVTFDGSKELEPPFGGNKQDLASR